MNLRRKTLVIVSLTLVSVIAVLLAATRSILLDSYASLEEQRVRRNVDRAKSALANDLAALGDLAGDWAAWDDTYAFIQDNNQEFLKSNLNTETLVNIRLNFILFFDASGRLVVGRDVDLEAQENIPPSKDVAGALRPQLPAILAKGGEAHVALFPGRVVLLAAYPILTSEHKGPPRGVLFMGRDLDAEEVARLEKMTRLTLRVYRADDPEAPADVRSAMARPAPDAPPLVRVLDRHLIAGYALVNDMQGRPALVMEIREPREIYAQGRKAIQYLVVAVVIAGVVLGGVTMVLLERAVLARLQDLIRGVDAIRRSGDLSGRITAGGKDEVTDLASAVNALLETRERSRRGLEESEQKYRTLQCQLEFILGATKTGLDIIDADFNVRYIDPEWGKVYGDPAGRKCYEYFMGRDSICPGCGVTKALQTKQATVTEEVLVRENNRPIQVTTKPFQNSDGEWLVAEVNADIRDRKRAEEQLARLNARLEELATTDDLTRLWNRRRFLEMLEHECQRV